MWGGTSDGQVKCWNVVTRDSLQESPLGEGHPFRHAREIEGQKTYLPVTSLVGVRSQLLDLDGCARVVFGGGMDQSLRRYSLK